MEEELITRPKWLLELENRKRKPRLAHEAGAGAPCTNCNSACPGLDLHFWRKICKNCKCSRDDHDVDDDEFPQFDLLFGPSGKFKKKSMRLQVNNNEKQNDDETTFEWVPPDTTKELAMDYMKALPAEKLPIKGSVGAVLRRQLLQKQLPLHDIDHKVCDELSEQEQKQFEKYLENIKKYVGQGKVMKMLGARPFDHSLMTPVNATDMQKCSPAQHKSHHIPSTGVQLRTPSSFTVKGPYARHPYDAQNKQDVATATNNNEISTKSTEEYNCTLDNVSVSSNVARSQPIEEKSTCENFQRAHNTVSINEKDLDGKMVNFSLRTHFADFAEQERSVPVAREKHSSGNDVSYERDVFEGHRREEKLNDRDTNDETAAAFIAESMLADALLPPSAIHANDIIGSTLDEKGLIFIREKLADKYNVQTSENSAYTVSKSIRQSLDAMNDTLYLRGSGAKENNNSTGTTAGITAAIDLLPAAERTEVGSTRAYEAERKMYKLESQIVKSATVIPTCCSININEQRCCRNSNDDKAANNDPLMMDASKAIIESTIGSHTLSNKHNSTDPAFPESSNLSTQTSAASIDAKSNPLQVELSSSILQSSVIHSEQLQNQVFPHIVGNCNEQYTQLTDCLKDAIENLRVDSTRKVHKCQKCHEDIHIGDVVVIAEKANNASWHPGCFVCSVCNELLVDLVYFYYKTRLYCERDLAAFLGVPRCFACDELIFVREYTVAEGHNYHVKHFCCWDCDVPLAGRQYIIENDRPLCLSCYQKSYAKTCAACNIAIAADQQGVAIKNLNFHATQVCFCCHSCKKNLLNGRMAIKKDKLFCSKECIAKFFN